jgi:hypothetical protein
MSPDPPVPTGNGSATKFPHTRALLAALAREYGVATKNTNKSSSETSDSEPESDGKEDATNSDTLVAQVIQLLDDEDEDALKELLKETFDISDESVSVLSNTYRPYSLIRSPRPSTTMYLNLCTSVGMILPTYAAPT